ncbi:hypothetical protein EDC04DRAFT_2617696, partial [Pisolithus marmoratus]
IKKLRQWNRAGKCPGREARCCELRVKNHLHYGPQRINWKDKAGGDVAMEVEDVVYASTLFMLTCGHLVAFDESYTTMKQAIIRLQPEYTIMFTAPDFISAVAKMFVVTYSIQVLIQGHDLFAIFQDLLNVSTDLRMHTDIFVVPQSSAPMGQGFAYGMLNVRRHSSVVLIEMCRRFACEVPKGQGDDWVSAQGGRQTEKISSIIDIRLLSTNRIAEKLGAKVLSTASVFQEIEMFHPIEPSTIPQNMLVSLAFCESDNYAKRAAILQWTAAFECSPYCKLDMYHTIHALHVCSPPSGPHRLLSSMFQVHLTVDVSLGILMVSARAGVSSVSDRFVCRGTTVDSLSMEARRGPCIYEPQGFSGVGSSWASRMTGVEQLHLRLAYYT